MKVAVNQIPPKGLTLEEELKAQALDLETQIIKFRSPVRIKAYIYKVTNVVSVSLALDASILATCSRCLNEFESKITKRIELNYPLDAGLTAGLNIDLDSDIREEILLEYPLKPLCSQNCKGLCQKCGKNLNEGECACKVKSQNEKGKTIIQN